MRGSLASSDKAGSLAEGGSGARGLLSLCHLLLGRATVVPLVVFLLAAAVYGRTLAPTFTWSHDGADGGDLIAAVATLGVPHPSGYPTYVLLGRLFLQARFLGEPAVRLHWLSALCGASAAALLACSIVESLRATPSASAAPRWLLDVAVASATLIFAFSPLQWSQATIAEVHALNVAFVAALFWLLLRWRRLRSPWLAVTAAFVYGLGLGNHLTGLLLLPVVILWFLRAGAGSRLTPLTWLGVAGAFLLGLGVYAYLPLAAMRRPPINWGDPRTWQRFWWLVSGRLYREAIFGVPTELAAGRLSAWARVLLDQYGWWGWALAFAGIWRLSRRDRAVLTASAYVFVTYSIYALGYDRADSYVYLLPCCLVMSFWLGQGLIAPLQAIWWWRQQATCRRQWLAPSPLLIASLLVALLPIVPLMGNWSVQDLRQDWEAAEYAASALGAVGPDALIVTSSDRTTFALWYRRYALGERDDVAIVNAGLWGFDWYRETLATHHPAVALADGERSPPELAALMAANLRWRLVYVTQEARDAAGEHPLQPEGPLYRLQPHGR